MALQQRDEINVLRHDDIRRFPRLKKDMIVLRSEKSKFPQWHGGNSKCFTQVASNSRGQLGVHPYCHIAKTGWSMRRRANIRQALRSSDSRSGISAKI